MSNPERFHQHRILPRKPVRGTPGWRLRNALWTACGMVLFVLVLAVVVVGFLWMAAFLCRAGYPLALVPLLLLLIFVLVFGSTYHFDKS